MSSLLTLTASAFLTQLDNQAIGVYFEGLHHDGNAVMPYHIAKANFSASARQRATASISA